MDTVGGSTSSSGSSVVVVSGGVPRAELELEEVKASKVQRLSETLTQPRKKDQPIVQSSYKECRRNSRPTQIPNSKPQPPPKPQTSEALNSAAFRRSRDRRWYNPLIPYLNPKPKTRNPLFIESLGKAKWFGAQHCNLEGSRAVDN